MVHEQRLKLRQIEKILKLSLISTGSILFPRAISTLKNLGLIEIWHDEE